MSWKSPRFLAMVFFIVADIAAAVNNGSLNHYVDEGIEYIHNNEETAFLIDPLSIPDIKSRKLKTSDMILTGLSSVHRSGDCAIMYEGNQTILEVNLAAEDLHLKFRYKAKHLIWISGRARLHLTRLSVMVSAYLDVYSGEMSLHSIKVVEFGEIKVVEITGFSRLFNDLVRRITNLILRRSKGKVIRYIEKQGSKLLAEELSKSTFLKGKAMR